MCRGVLLYGWSWGWRGVSCFEEVKLRRLDWLAGTANTSLTLRTSELLVLLGENLRLKLELQGSISSCFIQGTLPSVGPTRAGEEGTEGEDVSTLGNSCVLHMLLLV